MLKQENDNIEDFSASSTLLIFDPPLPLLRGPLPAGLSDDPSVGPFVLAFRDDRAWNAALRACKSKIRDQCEDPLEGALPPIRSIQHDIQIQLGASLPNLRHFRMASTEHQEGGARIGCSISASSKCKPPWWKTLFGGAEVDYSERERCEEREMKACIAASKESCLNFSQDKCLIPFRDARISSISQKEISESISQAATNNSSQSNELQQPLSLRSLEVTNFRGSALLDAGTSPK